MLTTSCSGARRQLAWGNPSQRSAGGAGLHSGQGKVPGLSPLTAPTHQRCSGSYSSSTREPSSRAGCMCCPRSGHTRYLRYWCRTIVHGSLRKQGPEVSGSSTTSPCPEPQHPEAWVGRLFESVPVLRRLISHLVGPSCPSMAKALMLIKCLFLCSFQMSGIPPLELSIASQSHFSENWFTSSFLLYHWLKFSTCGCELQRLMGTQSLVSHRQ